VATPRRRKGRYAGHPLARLGGTVARLPRYLRLGRALMGDPAVSPGRKALLGLSVAYALSPIDLVPGVIPVLGQLDDLTVLLLGLRRALDGCAPEAARAHLERAGLSESALEKDLANALAAAGWIVGRGARLGAAALTLPFRLARWALAPRSA
jgi:uncharacterized membrane protein YkvA (DUF1232 family)